MNMTKSFASGWKAGFRPGWKTPAIPCWKNCARLHRPDEIWLRCVRENEKAWRWYEREGFAFEKEQVDSTSGRVMKYYRWRKLA
jgi:hypothetical protein